jgi:hypothetical protein
VEDGGVRGSTDDSPPRRRHDGPDAFSYRKTVPPLAKISDGSKFDLIAAQDMRIEIEARNKRREEAAFQKATAEQLDDKRAYS